MLTFVEFIERAIKRDWDLPALSNYREAPMSYGQTGKMIKKIHRALAECGIAEEEKVVQVGRNNVNWAVTFLATTSYGTVSVPILQDFSISDLENTINHSDAVLVFVSDYIFEKMDDLLFKYFPFLDWDHVIVTSKKQMIRGDVLIDDVKRRNADSRQLCNKR